LEIEYSEEKSIDYVLNTWYNVFEVVDMTSSDLIKILRKDGWILKEVKGSHNHFVHPVKSGKVTVPHPKKDLPIGTVNSILKQAGLK